ncbi:MAG TPA: trypsin-like peptidase domain-containing protein, partial [Pyrinomonadaceae bacterium]|nr:trypsin-like peptidase domain-containing protein [Pyrinomonadaceae bacterium]
MASGIVIHISAGDERHTEVLSSDRIRIGAGEDCDLRLRPSALPKGANSSALLVELSRQNGFYRVTDFNRDLKLTYNGAPLEPEVKIDDGDELRLDSTELAMHFFPIRSLPAVINQRHEPIVAPFIEHAAIEAAATTRRDDAKVFLREFTRELVREINPSTKIISLAIAALLVLGVLYIGFSVFSMYKEMKLNRQAAEEQGIKLQQMQDQLGKANSQLSNTDRRNQQILDSLSLAPKLRTDFGGGVCLVSGSYIFVERGTGRPLRYPETQTNEEGAVIQNGNEPAQLTPEGHGVIAEFEFVGTGFYVGDGYVLTNRHVAQPWQVDERAQSLSGSVSGQPRLKKLMAFFPNHQQPIPLKFKQAAQRDDLAVCTLDLPEPPTDIPVLPLDRDSDAAAVGKAVVMMGYPSGPDRLLALLDDAEARSIQARYGSSLESLLGYLAERNHIQPLTTQGHITDLDVRRIVYDARTAEGGSGAPLFGQSGRV